MVKRLVVMGQNSKPIKKILESDSALSRERKFVLLKKEKQSLEDKKKKTKTPSINRGRESTFWKNVKSITPNIFWTRIETYGTPGIPDLLGVFISKKCNKAKGVEERAIYFWPGAVARELSVNFREVEPLFTVHQPWTLELEPALERVLVPVPE
jgi:hypothetical protein